MRLLPILALLVLLAPCVVARADAPTTMVIRNLTPRTTRVQVALGPALPCDSSENRLMLDAVLASGETRSVALGIAAIACARSTSPGSRLDWEPSRWVRGGYRCPSKYVTCTRDPSVLMRCDVGATP